MAERWESLTRRLYLLLLLSMDDVPRPLKGPCMPLQPSSAFVRPGSTWPSSTAQTVEEVQDRIRKSCTELLRLERSIAFIGENGNDDYEATVGLIARLHCIQVLTSRTHYLQDKLKQVLIIMLPNVTSHNLREIDEAIKAMFEVLSPWSACIVRDSNEDTRWQYWIHRCNLRLIQTLNPELVAKLPKEQVDILDVHSQSAKDAILTGDMMAKIWNEDAAAISQQAAKPVDGKLKGGMAALKRQVRFSMYWIQHAEGKADYIYGDCGCPQFSRSNKPSS